MEEKTYKIGEAAALLNLKSYVLRFWETEFPQLNPLRTEKGQRLYTEADLAMLRRVKHLLHDRGLTIEGARKILSGEPLYGPETHETGDLARSAPKGTTQAAGLAKTVTGAGSQPLAQNFLPLPDRHQSAQAEQPRPVAVSAPPSVTVSAPIVTLVKGTPMTAAVAPVVQSTVQGDARLARVARHVEAELAAIRELLFVPPDSGRLQ